MAWFERSAVTRLAVGLLLTACALLPLVRQAKPAAPASPAALELPTQWEGHPLRPMALSAVEQRFAAQFPGRIERMGDGSRTLVLREVHQATRMLHPAADCYRGLGYRIEQARLERDAEERLWRCFTAARPGGGTLHVCERIVDRHGKTWTDTSAWFWAAASGSTQGPWQAITIATPLGEGA